MSIHKLTAGDGYSYLTRQVAALDATDKGHTGLSDYYSQQGESPGRWLGSALGDVDLRTGDEVTPSHMAALFGEGKHPRADAITDRIMDKRAGGSALQQDVEDAIRLGRPFAVIDTAPAFRVAVAKACAEANAALGMPRDWPLAAAERARIRTDVGRAMFAHEYGRPAKDPRELSSFIARHSRAATTAVAGFDLTFSPVKSVSALWAIAPKPVADQILAAHHAAVADTIGWIEREAIYTRGGQGGVQQLDTTGVLAAGFDHRDSRAGDPDLHTHVAVSNKVRVRNPDGTPGRWLAVDGRVLFKATVSASERYNTRLETELHTRLGVTFEERSDAAAATAAGRRTVREIIGVPQELSQAWSSRRAVIDTRRAALTVQFQAQHGRPPTPIEAVKLAQQATLETRDAKHSPRSEAEQRRIWRAEATKVLGSERAVDAVATFVVSRRRARLAPSRATVRIDEADIEEIVARTASVVQENRSTWQVWHVRAEAERQVRGSAPAGADVDRLVDHVVTAVLDPQRAVPLTPADPVTVPDALRRRDGVSVYEVAGSRLFTSAQVLANEAYLVDAANLTGGRTVRVEDVDVALLECVANGVTLNTAQAHLVRQMATSGQRLQLAIAPAGSGKTTAMSALSIAWTASGGTVLGLAPSAVAASVLGKETGTCADTLAKLVWHLRHGNLPRWAEAVDSNTLLIIDEAGMASTGDLAEVTRFALGRGASIRLIGDDRQLASVAAGGVLRDLQATAGAVTLTELIRFRDQAEGAATLALRGGDTTAIGFYIDRDRVHVGDLSTVTDHAYTAWSADRAAGLDSIMLAPTRDLVTGLNVRARDDRIARLVDAGGDAGPSVPLADGSAASAGDVVITRRNERDLRMTATDWVKNGDRWTVSAVGEDGALTVVHNRTGRRIALPSDYVAADVQLGYAATVHGGQGVTADTAHTVAIGDETRQQLYVALTRGRDANHLYLMTAMNGDEHSVITPAATHPLTAVNVLEQVLARDEAQISAITAAGQMSDPAVELATANARYRDSLGHAAALLQGPGWTERVEDAADQVVPGITDSPAWPTLRSHLALIAADGHEPITALAAAVAAREVATADDVAAVLDWRLDPTHTRSTSPGPLPWLPGIPQRLIDEPTWGPYLSGRADQVADAEKHVRAAAHVHTPATAPAWSRLLMNDQHRQLRADVAVFRAAHAVPDEDTRPTGPRQMAAAARRIQRRLNEQVAAAIDTSYRTGWAHLAVQVGLHPAADPHWPILVEHLAALSHAGADAPALLRAAVAEAPLPDECQAAAVWWRIARHSTPAVLTPDPSSRPANPLRPAWLQQMATTLTPTGVQQLLEDRHWPAVVTAVNRAIDHGIPAADVLRQPVGLDGDPVPDHALADALIYRAATLTDPDPYDPTPRDVQPDTPAGVETHGRTERPRPKACPADPYDNDLTPPGDLHMVTIDVDPHTPRNLAVPDIEAADEGQRERTADAPTPLPDETAASSEMAMSWPDLDAELFAAAQARQWLPDWEPSPAQQERILARAADAQFSPVTPERIAELNEQAATFYQHTFRGSWAQTYLTDRLGGTDLTADLRTRPGYAPARWTTLTRVLRRHGATDEELLAAGLAKQASTGRLIDTFRDRLVLPIEHHGQVVGFVGRRNPYTDNLEAGTDAAVKAGPKYLNTAETVLFAKGDQLYGMDPYADRLAAGAIPVVVEGPIDAIAVSLASPGHVGVAPLGTALTDTQADILTRRPGARLIVATDADTPGQVAAERDFWILTARGADPQHATLPRGLDPAEVLRTAGPNQLRHHLENARPLADTLITERLAHLPASDALAAALPVVAAGRTDLWVSTTTDIASRLHLPAQVALTQLLPVINAWDRDRDGQSQPRIHSSDTRDRLARQATLKPAQRWAPIARQIHPALVRAGNWGALANTIDRAEQAGYDVQTLLPAVAAARPLDPDSPATDLRYRLVAELPADESPLPRPPSSTPAPRPPSARDPRGRPGHPRQQPGTGRSGRNTTPSR